MGQTAAERAAANQKAIRESQAARNNANKTMAERRIDKRR